MGTIGKHKEKQTEGKKCEGGGRRAGPESEARLCLCLGLIDFLEELLFTVSSLVSNEVLWHLPPQPRANTSTALLHSAGIHTHLHLPLRHMLSNAHTVNLKQTYTCIHGSVREIDCPTQTANKGSVKRMWRVVAFVYAHCLGFYMLALLLYP